MTEHEPQSVPVCWVSQEDILSCQPDDAEQLANLDASDMAFIANKLGDALQETYWLALGIIVNDYVRRKINYDKPGAGST